jgi:hypothetical protein
VSLLFLKLRIQRIGKAPEEFLERSSGGRKLLRWTELRMEIELCLE